MIVESEVTDAPMAQIVVDNAKAAFAQVLELFHPPVVVPREVHYVQYKHMGELLHYLQ